MDNIELQEEKQWEDKDYVIEQIKKNGTNLEQASPLFRGDIKICQMAVEQNGLALEYCANHLKNNFDLVQKAVSKNGLALEFASNELKENPKIVLTAIKNCGLAIEYANEKFKKNKKFIIIALQQNGDSVFYIDKNLKKQKDIALIAVQCSGRALIFFDNFKDDEEIAKMAIINDGCALQYCSLRLQQQPNLIFLAIKQAGIKALNFLNPLLKQNICHKYNQQIQTILEENNLNKSQNLPTF